MSYLIGALVIAVGLVLLGVWIGSLGEDKKRTLRRERSQARAAISNINDTIHKYTGGLDTVGQAMYNEVQSAITNYWKDTK